MRFILFLLAGITLAQTPTMGWGTDTNGRFWSGPKTLIAGGQSMYWYKPQYAVTVTCDNTTDRCDTAGVVNPTAMTGTVYFTSTANSPSYVIPPVTPGTPLGLITQYGSTLATYNVCNISGNTFQLCQAGSSTVQTFTDNGTGTLSVLYTSATPFYITSLTTADAGTSFTNSAGTMPAGTTYTVYQMDAGGIVALKPTVSAENHAQIGINIGDWGVGISIPSGATPGAYTFGLTSCQNGNGTGNCSTLTKSVTVVAPPTLPGTPPSSAPAISGKASWENLMTATGNSSDGGGGAFWCDKTTGLTRPTLGQAPWTRASGNLTNIVVSSNTATATVTGGAMGAGTVIVVVNLNSVVRVAYTTTGGNGSTTMIFTTSGVPDGTYTNSDLGIMEFDLGANVAYYEGWRVYDQIATYTGDASWRNCSLNMGVAYRDRYILANSGTVQAYDLYPLWLPRMATLSGESSYITALQALGGIGGYNGVPVVEEGGDARFNLTREMAYALDWCTTRLGIQGITTGSTIFGIPWLTVCNNTLDAVLSAVNADVDNVGQPGGYQSFIDTGLSLEALIKWFTYYNQDPRIYYTVKRMADYAYANFYDATTHSFAYSTGIDGPYCNLGAVWFQTDIAGHCIGGIGSSGPYALQYIVNGLIVPSWGWLWSLNGDSAYQIVGDDIFSHIMNSFANVPFSGKEFSQNYRWSFDYVSWRSIQPPSGPITSQISGNGSLSGRLN